MNDDLGPVGLDTIRRDPLRAAAYAALLLAVLLIPVAAMRVPGVNLRIALIAMALPTGLAAVRAVGERRMRMPAPLVALALLLAAAILALPADQEPTAVAMTLTYVLAVGTVWAVVQVCEPPDVARLLRAFAFISGVVAAIALVARSAPASAHAGGTVINGRLAFPFSQPNELGEFCALALPIAIAAVWHTPAGLRRLVLVGCIGLDAAALALSFSRGGWMAAAAAVVTLAVLLPRLRRLVVAGGLALGAAVAVALAAPAAFGTTFAIFGNRIASLASGADGPYDRRPQYWQQAWELAAEHPIVGAGPGGFMHHTRQAASGVYADPADHAHSVALTILAEQGMLGLIAAVVLLISLIAAALRLFVHQRSGVPVPVVVRWTSAAPLAAMAATVVHGLTDVPFRNPIVMVAVSLVLGCASASPYVRRRRSYPRGPHDEFSTPAAIPAEAHRAA